MPRHRRRRPTLEFMEERRMPSAVTILPVTATEPTDNEAVFTATLDAASSTPITLTYATVNGSARAGKQYDATDGSITIPAGATSATIAVPLIATDVSSIPIEKFFVDFKVGSGNTVTRQTFATIVDANPLPTVSSTDLVVPQGSSGTTTTGTVNLSLSNPSYKPVRIIYDTDSVTATSTGSGKDYRAEEGVVTIPAGSTTGTFEVRVLGSSTAATDEVFDVDYTRATNASLTSVDPAGLFSRVVIQADATTISRPTVTVSSPTVVEGGEATFDVTLSAASTQAVSFRYATEPGTADASRYTSADGIVTIPAGQTSATITVATTVGSTDTGSQQFSLDLSAPANAVLASDTASATILDDDPVPSLSVSGTSASAPSSGTETVDFTVNLSSAFVNPVTVSYATVDGSAVAGTGYAATSGTLTFEPGVTSLEVPVTVLAESTPVASETFGLQLSGASGATVATSTATATIVTTPTLSASGSTATVGTTGSSSVVFLVSLSSASTVPVTVDYATANGTATAGTDYTAESGTLTFEPGETEQAVVVPVAGESTTATSKTFTLNLTGAVNTTNTTASATGTINDETVGSTVDLSDNLANSTTGTETATGTTYVAASFGTDASSFTLNSVTLQLAETAAGSASVEIFSDGGLQPGSLVGTLTSPAAYSSTASATTFTSTAGIALTANTTYWIVLVANTGSFAWSWTDADTGSGPGFQDAWAESDDGGSTWFSYDSSPTQFSVQATVDS